MPPPTIAMSYCADNVAEDVFVSLILVPSVSSRLRRGLRREVRINTALIDLCHDHLRPVARVGRIKNFRHQALEFSGACDQVSIGAQALRKLHQVGTAQAIEMIPDIVGLGLKVLHTLAYHVQVAIFQGNPYRAPLVRPRRGYVGTMHHERPVTNQRDASLFGTPNLRTDY